MKLKIDTELNDEKGNPIGDKVQCIAVKENGDFLLNSSGNITEFEKTITSFKRTLKKVICESLLYEDQKALLSPELKNNRYQLWMKISNADKVIELTAEEIVLIQKSIGHQPILILGQCKALIEE